jgi:uncharacterized surface protein with fasciclin (FAS1) repeats
MRCLLAAPLLLAVALARPAHAQHRDLIGTAQSAGKFATLLAAVDAADLTATLRSKGPFTLFAPTDEAFARLPTGTVESLLRPENRDKLRALLLYHVVSGRVPASTASTLASAKTVEGRSIRIRANGSTLQLNNATVVMADVGASNGIIHVIDQVLLPPEPGADLGRMSSGSPTDARAAARDLLRLAIRRGAPLYNDGQPEATTAIYEVAARAIIALGDEVPGRVRTRLERGLRDASAGDGDERAWTLRRALDDAGRGLDGRSMMLAEHHQN